MGRKHGLKVLGLSLLAALGLTAMSTAAAQAGSEILVNEAALVGEKAISGSIATGEILTTEIPIKISCTGGVFLGTIKNVSKVGEGKVQILFTGCTLPGLEPSCQIYEELPKLAPKSILATGEFKLIVHEEKHYLLVKGLGESESFADFVVLDPLLLERCFLDEGHYGVRGLAVLGLPDILTLAKLHKIETLEPELTAKLFPSHKLVFYDVFGGDHLKSGTSAFVKLASGESWRVQ
jgi:hypothetical protein